MLTKEELLVTISALTCWIHPPADYPSDIGIMGEVTKKRNIAVASGMIDRYSSILKEYK